MNIRDIKEFINKLSSDFNDKQLSIEVGSKSYQVEDVQLTSSKLVITTKEEKFSDTIFDAVIATTLKCISWNTGIKLQMVKATKEATGLGLKDSKDLIDANIPFTVACGKSEEEYIRLKNFFPDGAMFEIETE